MEVGVVIVAGQPAGGLVGYLIGLGAQVLVLYEAAEGSGGALMSNPNEYILIM